jgi:hypothetical protein
LDSPSWKAHFDPGAVILCPGWRFDFDRGRSYYVLPWAYFTLGENQSFSALQRYLQFIGFTEYGIKIGGLAAVGPKLLFSF